MSERSLCVLDSNDNELTWATLWNQSFDAFKRFDASHTKSTTTRNDFFFLNAEGKTVFRQQEAFLVPAWLATGSGSQATEAKGAVSLMLVAAGQPQWTTLGPDPNTWPPNDWRTDKITLRDEPIEFEDDDPEDMARFPKTLTTCPTEFDIVVFCREGNLPGDSAGESRYFMSAIAQFPDDPDDPDSSSAATEIVETETGRV